MARRIPAAFTTESRPPNVPTAERTPSTTDRSSPMFISNVVRRSPPPASCGLGAGLVQPVGGDVGGDDGGTLVQQSQRGRLPDARCRTGHQDPISLQVASCVLLSGVTGP